MNQSLTYKKLRDYILIVFVYLFFRMNSYFTRGSTIEQFLLIGRVAIIALSFLLIFRVRFIPNKSMIILTGGSSFWFFLTGLQNYSGSNRYTDKLSNPDVVGIFLDHFVPTSHTSQG